MRRRGVGNGARLSMRFQIVDFNIVASPDRNVARSAMEVISHPRRQAAEQVVPLWG